MENLQRRASGTYIARLTVPERLRRVVGQREFIATTGTTHLSVAKLVAATLLARWRQQLFDLDRIALAGHRMHHDTIVKIADGYPFEFWLPLLGLLAGYRLKEACQLHLTDIKQIDGVWRLDLNERTADKSLKNEQSERIVSLHPKLIERGLIGWQSRRPAPINESGHRYGRQLKQGLKY